MKDTTKPTPAAKAQIERKATLTTSTQLRPETSDDTFAVFVRDGEMYARALENPDCPEAFKNTFGALFCELFNLWGAGESDPRLVRVLYPIMRADLADNGTADGLSTSIFTLYDVLAEGAGE